MIILLHIAKKKLKYIFKLLKMIFKSLLKYSLISLPCMCKINMKI